MYDKRIKRNYILLLLLGILVFFFASSETIIYFFDRKAIDNIMKDVIKDIDIKEVSPSGPPPVIGETEDEEEKNDYWDYTKTPFVEVEFSKLIEKNPDTVGWIKLNGTNINYPIVQRPDNKYYLTHAFDGSKNSAGWVFMDFRNSFQNFDRNTILYGHGRVEGTMFGTLKNVTKENWFNKKENHIVKLSTPSENTLWQVFSVYIIKEENYYIQTKFNNNEDYLQFLNVLKSRSKFSFDSIVNDEDQILTLSTCYGDNTERVVLHAKLIKKELRS